MSITGTYSIHIICVNRYVMDSINRGYELENNAITSS